MNDLNLFNQPPPPPAIAARDRGMKKVLENNKDWIAAALEALAQYPHGEAMGEDLKAFVTQRLGEPFHVNAIGAFIKAAMRAGVIVPTGEWRQSKMKSSHARRNPVYRVTPRL